MARADLVVAVGDEVLEECAGRFHVPAERAVGDVERARVPFAVESPLRIEPRPRTPRSIFVGALTSQKRPDRFVEVVRSLRAEGRAAHGLIVGDGPLAGDLAVLAADQGMELLGPRSDVPELLRRSDVFVFASLPTGEGMPGVLIEAGLSGLPSVSTPVPGATNGAQQRAHRA